MNGNTQSGLLGPSSIARDRQLEPDHQPDELSRAQDRSASARIALSELWGQRHYAALEAVEFLRNLDEMCPIDRAAYCDAINSIVSQWELWKGKIERGELK